MLKTDVPSQVEWAVIANSQSLDNSTRTEFDAVVDSGGFPFNTSDPRCRPDLPTNREVRIPCALECQHGSGAVSYTHLTLPTTPYV